MKYDVKNKIRKVDLKKTNNTEVKKPVLKMVFIFFIAFLFSILFITLAIDQVLGVKLFYPRDIIIQGLTHQDIPSFIEENGLKQTFIVNFYKKELKDRLKALYYVKDIKVGYRLFNVIVLKIEEKSSAYILYDEKHGAFYYMADDGTVLERCASSDMINFYIISLDEGHEIKIGDKLIIPEWLSDLPENYHSVVSQIQIRDNNEVVVYFPGIPYYGKFGNYISQEKIENFVIISKIVKDKDKVDYIDLSIPSIGRIVEKEESVNG